MREHQPNRAEEQDHHEELAAEEYYQPPAPNAKGTLDADLLPPRFNE